MGLANFSVSVWGKLGFAWFLILLVLYDKPMLFILLTNAFYPFYPKFIIMIFVEFGLNIAKGHYNCKTHLHHLKNFYFIQEQHLAPAPPSDKSKNCMLLSWAGILDIQRHCVKHRPGAISRQWVLEMWLILVEICC